MTHKKTMTKLIGLTLMVILLASTAPAQENQKTKTLKLYSNFGLTTSENSIFSEGLQVTTVTTNRDYDIGYMSPALAFVKQHGNFHEIELSRFKINNKYDETTLYEVNGATTTISGQYITNILIALRYEYDIMFLKKKETLKLRPYLGFGVNPYFLNSIINPIVATNYPTRQNDFGASISIIPRLNYNITERWFLDLNIPINVTELAVSSQKTYNPLIREEDQRTTNINYEILPSNFLIRIGIGIKI
jgi:outer membrane protein W